MWVVTRGKGPRGLQPGFRAERPATPVRSTSSKSTPSPIPARHRGRDSSARLVYHALGYFVEDVYVLKVHPRNFHSFRQGDHPRCCGRAQVHAADLANILRVGAQRRGRPGLFLGDAIRR